MLQSLEKILLHFIIWFYQQPSVLGLVVLGTPATVLLIVQFYKRKKTLWPGLLGLFFLGATLAHIITSPRMPLNRISTIKKAEAILSALETPHDTAPIPVLEPIFRIFVAPAEYRFIHEEVLFVMILLYLFFVGLTAWRSYKATGLIIGDLSPKALFDEVKRRRPKRSQSNELGSGDLANAEQIARWTKPSGKPCDTVLHVRDLRGSEGTVLREGKLYISREERNRHILIVAKTGSGKTTKLILPVLYNDCLDKERSTVVIDSKPEMWSKLANFTRKYNPDKEIVLFNPLDTVRSLSWNIVSKIENDTDAKLIANTIIMATDNPAAKSDSPFFRNNALAILNAIMVGLLHDPEETLSMPRVHELVQSGMKPLCDWLEAHPHALRNTRTFVELARSGSQNADTIMSELGMRLSAWDLHAIRATTAFSEFDLETLVEKPTLFIVELRESEIEMLRPMANVIVVEILRFLTKRAESCKGHSLPRPVGLVIDEFASSLGRLPDIHVKLNTLRSRNVSIVASIQSIAQIKANYGDDADSVLAGFSTKIFMPALDIQDAEWASKETGNMTIRFETSSTGSNKKLVEWFASKNDSTQEQVQQRAVLTPEEIGRPVDNICTIFMPNTPVFQGHLVPFYKIPSMLKAITESEEQPELKLRSEPIKYEEKLPTPGSASAQQGQNGQGGLPPGITDTRGWTHEQIRAKLDEVKKKLDWENTTGSARKWWEAFERENESRLALVLRLAEELANRKATITEFFLAYVYSNTDNIQANLHYLDYTRLKKEEEKKKREQQSASQVNGSQAQASNSSQNPPSSSQQAVVN
ncbi:MAG: hypothetical protein D6780_05135 [Candidatus Dadabacteria bacterium]|nr:MAG: hypothetical protein D6780_05135 [Candidatus Dadabacteria bacterium]